MKVQLRYYENYDWEAIYIDGKKVYEGHRPDHMQMLELLDIQYEDKPLAWDEPIPEELD
jgi:hypothetical protein